jgi:uncharacterized SAM-binding protein YcdF (DUF218 family)
MMLESMARLLFELAQPTMQLVILLMVTLALMATGRRRWGLYALGAWVFLFLLYGNPFLAGTLVDRLQDHHPVLISEKILELQHEAGDEPVYVIVLGAGHTADPRLKPSQMLTSSVTMRLVEAIRVHRQLSGSRLVTSASANHGTYSQAEALRDAAIALGVDPEAIHMQTEPENTCQEARAFVRDHGPGARVVLATSARHMRRAMMIFEQQGARPVAAPTAYVRKRNPDRAFDPEDWLPSLEHIEDLESVIKEYVGYQWDRRRCRSDDTAVR